MRVEATTATPPPTTVCIRVAKHISRCGIVQSFRHCEPQEFIFLHPRKAQTPCRAQYGHYSGDLPTYTPTYQQWYVGVFVGWWVILCSVLGGIVRSLVFGTGPLCMSTIIDLSRHDRRDLPTHTPTYQHRFVGVCVGRWMKFGSQLSLRVRAFVGMICLFYAAAVSCFCCCCCCCCCSGA